MPSNQHPYRIDVERRRIWSAWIVWLPLDDGGIGTDQGPYHALTERAAVARAQRAARRNTPRVARRPASPEEPR